MDILIIKATLTYNKLSKINKNNANFFMVLIFVDMVLIFYDNTVSMFLIIFIIEDTHIKVLKEYE